MTDNQRICPQARPSSAMYTVDTGDWKFEEPVIDPEECVLCGRCAVYCPTKTISAGDQEYEIDLDWCKGCGICLAVCPTHAISMRESNKETRRLDAEENK